MQVEGIFIWKKKQRKTGEFRCRAANQNAGFEIVPSRVILMDVSYAVMGTEPQ